MSVNTKANGFAVKTEVFEGPLELLIDLVEKRKLLINDISLADVTDEYMSHVAAMQEMSLPGTANFVSLAATLLLIKSKSLLPNLELTSEEEESIEDLEERLRLYQIYRDASKIVAESFGKNICHKRRYLSKKTTVFAPDKNCTQENLQEAILNVIRDLPEKVVTPKVRVRPVISLEDMVERLTRRIQNQMKLQFSDLLENDKEKTTVIVGFLAVLESVKQGSILVAQLNRFEEIEIEAVNLGIPKYQ